jgi:hypothetical protein
MDWLSNNTVSKNIFVGGKGPEELVDAGFCTF